MDARNSFHENLPKLFVVSGPSGVGKGTICNRLAAKRDDIWLSVSVTERRRRENEVDGVSYNFVSRQQFDELIENNELLEWAQYGENRYGTPKKSVLEALHRGQNVILEIEVQGAKQIKANFPDAVLIFVVPPSVHHLEMRLRKRNTEKCEQIRMRLDRARLEMEERHKYNYIIINDKLKDAVGELEKIIERENEL